ncbi:ABC-type transport system periplasmic substrate-binding protein (probable substrate dipeptide/oligopeptide) (plasmid) [Natrialba magadii ATCC 43099]|uniref:ABC-type transport system periplasmic substrate-binding protein (Probable substrate dipeptide/oligopeptide) n=1 Tax=Natrialba magadii (strain ATCC 43099 / DSM 3394 / CCM 3739 / CIP 104546 / IAM 13178 / JCM 8861 / NBRC 102185 / NCIMB 2190 / MS3) TaxID=547559 RepID=D3T0T6_NATMM|nr:ABC transporter substrate-binding protein [Natrialba magadii]ADD07195.1 ABC-type transport system periplasmic substrate-binding protein (probable substrate dipeptide/oligopeptide) [Natrialba magadii ATCC 43099]ELY34309.1 family 5 extracellular solute-binding protein [Natrialba magadii ATCC 43099]
MFNEDTTSDIDRRRFIKSTAAIGAAGLFAGCVGTDPDETGDGGGTFRIATPDEVETFDPRMNQMVWYSTAAHYLFDSLFMLEPDGSGAVPHLADGELEEVDETTFVVDIRDDVTFHNGDQLTAEDVAYSLNWVRDPDNDSPNLSNVEFIDEAEATGEFEVTLHLDFQFALMERELSSMNAAIVPMDAAEEMGQEEFAQNPIGSGPFELANHDPSASVELTANDDYFLGEPTLGGVEYRIIPEAEVGFVELADGTIHQSSVTEALVDEAESNDNVNTYQISDFNFQGFIINCLEGPFVDTRAREAVQYLVDYDELLTGAVGDLGSRSVAHMPPGVAEAWDFPADEWREQYYPEQDHDRAVELFEEAGLGTDFEVDIVTMSGESTTGRSTVLQHEFQEVGIDASVREVSDGEWLDALDTGDYDINTYGWGGGDDPDGYYYRMFRDLANDDGGMSDDVVGHSSIGYLYEGARDRGDDELLDELERLDELVRAARETTDRDERYEYYVEAVDLLMPLHPVIGVYSAEGITGVHTDVQDYEPSPFGEQEAFNQWQEARIDD